QGGGNGGGYPGGGNPYPGQPYPNNPYPAPPAPGYSDIYGPNRTVRWQDMGSFRAQKFVETTVRLDARGQFVNELFLVAQDNQVQIRSAVARLVNGQIVDLRYLQGVIRQGQQLRQPLDYRNSLRVDSIELVIESSNLIGSRGSLNVQLGLAF
ncbi:MAG: hypothetical protein ABL930_09480, partial [Pseudobdellovibrio sp.]